VIRGYFGSDPGPKRPFVIAQLAIPALAVVGTVHFLIDTGADSTVLAPRDAALLHLDLSRLSAGPISTGVGGQTATLSTAATLTLGVRPFTTTLRVLAPTSPQQRRALRTIPSLLGRDMLSHFALILEERTDRVLLLSPSEADALALP
jgi:predicted aspartyl protease